MTVGNKSGGLTVTITTPTSGAAPVYNGYLVANGGISAYVGTKAQRPQPAGPDGPPGRPRQPGRGLQDAGTDYPANQPFVDPPVELDHGNVDVEGRLRSSPISDGIEDRFEAAIRTAKPRAATARRTPGVARSA